MATDLSQEAAMRKLRSTPVVRSKEPMPAETRMEIIELVQTNVDKVSTIIVLFSSLHCTPFLPLFLLTAIPFV